MSALIELQKKIGATPDGSFGPQTLKKAMEYFHLTKEQTAHFFGQCATESGEFKIFMENLNYSADRLLVVFPKYFPNMAVASSYARNPQKIASKVYANRMGNGNEASQDGWKYRGRGAIQLTGKSNYTLFASAIHDPTVLVNPDIVADKYAFESAKWFFDTNHIWNMCTAVNDATITNVSKKVNGGTHGLDTRKTLTKKYYSWL